MAHGTGECCVALLCKKSISRWKFLSGITPWSELFHSHGVYQHERPCRRVLTLVHTIRMGIRTIMLTPEPAYSGGKGRNVCE